MFITLLSVKLIAKIYVYGGNNYESWIYWLGYYGKTYGTSRY